MSLAQGKDAIFALLELQSCVMILIFFHHRLRTLHPLPSISNSVISHNYDRAYQFPYQKQRQKCIVWNGGWIDPLPILLR